jgi:quercetin dioxygenase-like cupin family protein
MKRSIHHLKYDDLPKVVRGRGIVNHPIASKTVGASVLHSGITYMPPRTSVPAHSHNAEEQVTVLEGTLKIVLDGSQEVFCSTYDSTFLSPGVTHELINDTDQHVLAMVIYGSANVNRTFAESGETVEIGSDQDKFD